MVLIRRILTILAIVTAYHAMALTDTVTAIFDDHFRTLQVAVDNAQLGYPPLISLNGRDQITISWDELADDRSWLRYSIIHCNADWQPSSLVDSEVLDGFNEGDVDDWAYSRSTAIPFVHYSITLPNEQFRFKVSGNYLLRVYRDDDPDTILLQARFMVTEDTADVSGDLAVATDIDYRSRHQQLSVSVEVSDQAHVEDIFNDLIVKIGQNGRTDNEVTLRQPLRAMGSKAIYEHQPALIFPAGNNYRRFETVSTTTPTIGVEIVEYNDPYYHAQLTTDQPRPTDQYLYDLNLHGNYVVRTRDYDNSDTDADYIVTHFSLDMPRLPGGAMIMIDGDLVNRTFSPEAMMVWNQATSRYERALLLKQGAYSYQYLVVEPGAQSGTTATIEGDHYQTRNRYVVRVYHRRRGERYDRLIGATIVAN